MPELTPISIPRDEAAAAAAGTRDFYADLTDEEREEEGLPPRENPGNGKAGDGEGEGGQEGVEGEDIPEGDEEDEGPAEDASGRLFEEIGGLREDLNTLLGRDETTKNRSEDSELIEAALEHDDPVVRGMAKQLVEAQKALAEVQADAQNQRVARQIAQDAADFDAVVKSHTIAGVPMTDAHVGAIEKYILANPEIGKRLSIEELTRVVFPGAVKAFRGTSRASTKAGSKVATVVTEGGTGGAPARPWKPRTNETIESAVQAAASRFGWKG